MVFRNVRSFQFTSRQLTGSLCRGAMGRFTQVPLAALLWLAVAGCNSSEPPLEATPKALPLGGKTVKLLVIDDAPLAEAVGRLRGEWQASTGAQLEIEEQTEDELLKADQLNSDAVVYPAYDLGLLAERDWLSPLPSEALADPALAWNDVFESAKSYEARWGANLYGIPFGSPVLTCLYRADLFQRFQRDPPQTWAEYGQLADFFSDREQLGGAVPEDTTAWQGALEPLGPGWAGLTLLARVAPYARHPNHYSTLFEIGSMDPLIAGPPFVRALEELLAAGGGSPRQLEFGPAEVLRAILAGQCAMALTWSDASFAEEAATAAAQSELEIEFCELPGSTEVYDPGAKTWGRRQDQQVGRVPLLGLAGRMGSVTRQSSVPDAARQLLVWLSGPEWSGRVCSASADTTLFRASHLAATQPWVAAELGTDGAALYAETVQQTLSGQEPLFAPRIPGRSRYLAALDAAVHQAAGGKATPQSALDEAARQWREITADFGVDSQRAAYRHCLGLE